MYYYLNQKDPKNEYIMAVHPQYGDMPISMWGCGICSAAMIVGNLTGTECTIAEISKLAAEWNYHTSGKDVNDMKILAPVVAHTYNLQLQMSSDPEELLAWLSKGGMAIVHLCGDHDGHIGVMSNYGHYVVAVKAEGRTLTILDPSLLPGKYDLEGRKEYVTVNGDECCCDVDIITENCKTKIPYFYLFDLKNK